MPKKQIITKSALIPTVLISGGAGFVGSHLAEYLLENKARVIVLDNFKTGKEIHVKHLLKNSNFALYDVDINEGIPLEIQSVDYIFHLAGLEEYLYSKEYLSLESLFTNSLGTKNLLDLAKKSSAKFLLASTIDVYQGRNPQLYLDEYFGSNSGEENKFSLIEAKRFAEALVWEYHKKHDVDVRIARLPEVYGPRMDLSSSGFLGGFIKNVIDGSSIEIYGDGVEKEYYLYISDVISGLIKAQFNEKTKGNIYSLVPDNSISALETSYLVRSLADAKLSIHFKPAITSFKGNFRTPDVSNIKYLNWKPKIGIKDGVTKTLESFSYSVNTHSFKPAKFIEQKFRKQEVLSDSIISLQGVKITSRPKESSGREVFDLEEKKESIPTTRKEKRRLFKIAKSPSGRVNIISKIKESSRDFRYKFKADMGYGFGVLAVVISAALVFIGIPTISSYLNIKKGISSLNNAQEYVLQMKSQEFGSETLSAYNSFKSARSSVRRLRWLFSLSGRGDNFISYDKLLGSLTSFSKAANLGSSAIKPLESVLETIRPDNPNILDESLFNEAKMGISGTKDYLKMAEADISSVDLEAFPEKYRGGVDEYKNILSKSQEIADSLSTVISDLPQILGISGEKKYIFWFQNSNEIRPTGGFIGSYGVLTIESGKLKDLFIDDIYNPDGQIDVRNIQVTPPDPIKKFLGEDVLYLRNSNWDPDFTRSSKTFDDIYFKITGETVDGYIALDLDFVERLLKVTGPIFLASYNEDINADNLDERAQYYSGFDYREGSIDKKSFLTILGGKLLERIFSFKKENLPGLLSEISKSLDQRHIQIYFSNSSINNLLKDKRWDGGLVDTKGDYLSVVNANLGGTKSNYYVENKMTYEINSMTRDGLLRADLYLDYKNTAENDAWPGGPYINYVRVLVQDGSKLTGAKIIYDGDEEKDIFKDVVISRVGKYVSFETDFRLNPLDSVRVVLNYDLPIELSVTKDSKKYSLLWQKQPGTSGDEFFFTFNPPFGSLIETKSENLDYVEESLKSKGIFNSDLEYFVILK